MLAHRRTMSRRGRARKKGSKSSQPAPAPRIRCPHTSWLSMVSVTIQLFMHLPLSFKPQKKVRRHKPVKKGFQFAKYWLNFLFVRLPFSNQPGLRRKVPSTGSDGKDVARLSGNTLHCASTSRRQCIVRLFIV